MGKDLIGKVLLNQFRIDNFEDAGGMKIVYKAWDLKRNSYLALKVLREDLSGDPSIYKKFRRGANALEKLTHPNIIQFYGAYKTENLNFILESYIDGITLKKILSSTKEHILDTYSTLSILKAICAALGYAHVHGVVHCDVKPSNIMIDKGGQIYLTDFDIARHTMSTTTSMAAAGTAAYMAPEQIHGDPVLPATDVYSLGVMLFEMLCGQRPFLGNESGTQDAGFSPAERTRYAHLHLSPPEPRVRNPSLPDAIASVIKNALAKKPSERYQTTSALYHASLSGFELTTEQVTDRFPIHRWLEKPSDQIGEEYNIDDKIKPPRKKSWRLYIPIIVFIIIISASGLWFGSNYSYATESQILNNIEQPPDLVEETVFAPPNQNTVIRTLDIFASTVTLSSVNFSADKKEKTALASFTMSPSQTPKEVTSTPNPRKPIFTAAETMYCRDGPAIYYEAHTMLEVGEKAPVLARWHDNNWLLIGVSRPDTRTKCCWVGGDGALSVDRTNLEQIDFHIDRIECTLSP